MRDSLADTVGQLLDGFYERIEYGVVVAGRVEKRVERRKQQSIIDQLISAQYHTPCQGNDGSGGGANANKPGSKTPGNLERPDEILSRIHSAAMDITVDNGIPVTLGAGVAPGPFSSQDFAQNLGAGVAPGPFSIPKFVQTFTRRTRRLLQAIAAEPWENREEAAQEAAHALAQPLRQARMMLGYDSRTIAFQGTSCGSCGGTLVMREDSPTAVRCAGTPAAVGCGTSYPWWDWPALAATAVLVDTEAACAWTGRKAYILHRWACDGRIVNHGRPGKGQALWNLAELPKHTPGEPLPPPPRKFLSEAS